MMTSSCLLAIKILVVVVAHFYCYHRKDSGVMKPQMVLIGQVVGWLEFIIPIVDELALFLIKPFIEI